jgi:hypothetical protein
LGVWRLAYAIVPPLIVAAAVALLEIAAASPERSRKIIATICVTVAVLQSIFVIVKNGPYS